MTPDPRLEARGFVTIAQKDGGWLVVYTCGHKAWWAVKPHCTQMICATCVHELLGEMA